MSNFNMNIKTIVKNAPRYTIQEKLKTKFRTCKFKAVFSLWQFRKKKTYSGKKKYVPTEIWHIEIHVKCMYLHSTHTS